MSISGSNSSKESLTAWANSHIAVKNEPKKRSAISSFFGRIFSSNKKENLTFIIDPQRTESSRQTTESTRKYSQRAYEDTNQPSSFTLKTYVNFTKGKKNVKIYNFEDAKNDVKNIYQNLANNKKINIEFEIEKYLSKKDKEKQINHVKYLIANAISEEIEYTDVREPVTEESSTQTITHQNAIEELKALNIPRESDDFLEAIDEANLIAIYMDEHIQEYMDTNIQKYPDIDTQENRDKYIEELKNNFKLNVQTMSDNLQNIIKSFTTSVNTSDLHENKAALKDHFTLWIHANFNSSYNTIIADTDSCDNLFDELINLATADKSKQTRILNHLHTYTSRVFSEYKTMFESGLLPVIVTPKQADTPKAINQFEELLHESDTKNIVAILKKELLEKEETKQKFKAITSKNRAGQKTSATLMSSLLMNADILEKLFKTVPEMKPYVKYYYQHKDDCLSFFTGQLAKILAAGAKKNKIMITRL